MIRIDPRRPGVTTPSGRPCLGDRPIARPTRSHRFAIVALPALVLVVAAVAAEVPRLAVPEAVLDGEAPGITVDGLAAEEEVRIHVLRTLEKWQSVEGEWRRVAVPLHAWAGFRADADGDIEVDTARPVAGMYDEADPLALLRIGREPGHPALAEMRPDGLAPPTEPSNEVVVHLERDGAIVAVERFLLSSSLEPLEVTVVAEGELHGVFARPREMADDLPVVISLHGSEGGSVAKARAAAERFAARGFASLAINYFARGFEGIDGLRTEHHDVPIETIARAREWLSGQDGVDVDRLALWGVSKGAEFALVAASRYPWVRAVVGVVATDVVWEGYSDSGGTGAGASSWSWGGEPLPYVPLFDFEPANEGVYRTNTERYSRSRRFYAEQVPAARIRVERIEAKLLLLAGDRDEVWASGDMSRSIVERMVAAGKSERVRAKIYPRAGHQISGVGTFPVFLYGVQSEDPDRKDVLAEGAAGADAWRRTVAFLREALPVAP